jgi:nitrous oxidase accessory protein NosD
MKVKRAIITLLVGVVLFVNVQIRAEVPTIQALVDNAQPGEVVVVPSGEYFENVVVYKPITLKASGEVSVYALNCKRHVFEVKADGVWVS